MKIFESDCKDTDVAQMDRKSRNGQAQKRDHTPQYVEHSSSACCVTLYIYITGDMVEFLCVTLRILYYISSYKYEFSQNVPSLDQYEAPSPVATACSKSLFMTISQQN